MQSRERKMKRNGLAMLALAVVVLVSGAVFAGDTVVKGKCVKVVDGDTLIVECDKAKRTVEIDGIDAPELDQPWGKETRTFVKQMVGGEKVEIEVLEGDGDVVRARVRVNGIDMSEMLVGRGLAWVSEDGGDADLVDLGERAKKTPCGLWTDADPQAPWDFREARS